MRRLIRDAARTVRERRQGRLVRVATNNVRTMAVEGANGYGRADSVLHEAAKQGIRLSVCRRSRDQGERNSPHPVFGCSPVARTRVVRMA